MSYLDPVLQNPLGYGLILAALLYGAYDNRGKIGQLLSGALGWLKRAPGVSKPSRKLALNQCDDVIAYLESVGCVEGVAYFRAGIQHLYHSHAE